MLFGSLSFPLVDVLECSLIDPCVGMNGDEIDKVVIPSEKSAHHPAYKEKVDKTCYKKGYAGQDEVFIHTSEGGSKILV